MNEEQHKQIRELIHDVLFEMNQHKRLSDEEYEAIIKYLSEGDACRRYMREEMGINLE